MAYTRRYFTLAALVLAAMVDPRSFLVDAGTDKTLAPTGGVIRTPAPITPFPTESNPPPPTPRPTRRPHDWQQFSIALPSCVQR